MKMIPVNKASEVCEESVLNNTSESHNDSSICIIEEDDVCEKLNKSELDIEIELCEDLLNSDCTENDLTENFDKEIFSDLSDSDSVSAVLGNYPQKKAKIEVSKSRNVEPCKSILNCDIESTIKSQNDVNISLLSNNCLQNSNKLTEIINNNALCNEEQHSDTTRGLLLYGLENIHSTIFDSVSFHNNGQKKPPQEKEVKGTLNTQNMKNLTSKESSYPLKCTFDESEIKEANALSVLSKAKDSTAELEFQNVEQCQDIKFNEVIKIPKNTTVPSNNYPETSNKSDKIFNGNVSNNGELSGNASDSTTSVLEKQHFLNLDREILSCNGEMKFPLENYEENTLRNIDFENQDIKNYINVNVAFNNESLGTVPELALSVQTKKKGLTEIDETSISRNHGFENDQENTIDPATLPLDAYKEMDDDELSLFAETDVSTIEEFEMSILDFSDSDEKFSTNESDEILLPSIKAEEKTVSSIIVKVPATSCTEPIENEEIKVLLDTRESKIKHTSTNDSDESSVPLIKVENKSVSNVVKVPTKTSQEIKEDEGKDLFDPRWEQIKQLTNDEERYQQVKKCWKSTTVPDPNRNLTYHSYRKRHFQDKKVSLPIQRKRMAESNLNDKNVKRYRSCTYHLDREIQTVSDNKRLETNKIILEMNKQISQVNKHFEKEAQRQCNPNRGYNSYAFGRLQEDLQNRIASIKNQYSQQAKHCTTKVESEINALNKARNEVLHFYKFYKGLNARNDPTVLTLEQNLELEEIENIYTQFNNFYK